MFLGIRLQQGFIVSILLCTGWNASGSVLPSQLRSDDVVVALREVKNAHVMIYVPGLAWTGDWWQIPS
jgi:hypothetical protein